MTSVSLGSGRAVRLWSRFIALGMAGAIVAGGCGSTAEAAFFRSGIRNSSDTTYIVEAGGGGWIAPPRSQIDFGYGAAGQPPTNVDVYSAACQKVASATLNRDTGLLTIGPSGEASATDAQGLDSMPPQILALPALNVVLGPGMSCSDRGWFVTVRNDSDESIGVTLNGLRSGNWSIPPHSRASLTGDHSLNSYTSDMIAIVFSTASGECRRIGSVGPLAQQSMVHIDASGTLTMVGAAEFWASDADSAYADVALQSTGCSPSS